MCIRRQITVILIALSTVFVSTSWLMQELFMAPAFESLEQTAAQKDLERCVEALTSDIENLTSLSGDWAAWDDCFNYVQGTNPDFKTVNLIDESFTTTETDYLCLLDRSAKVLWADGINEETGRHYDVGELEQYLTVQLRDQLDFENSDQRVSGIVKTAEGPMIVGICPIVPSNRSGTPIGVMVMGRLLNANRKAALARRTHLDVTLTDIALEDAALAHSQMAPMEEQKSVTVVDDQKLIAATTVNDLFGKPIIRIEVDVPRTVTQQGRMAARAAILTGVAGALLTSILVGITLRRRVAEPLQAMAEHAARVGEQDDLDARLDVKRNDEIGRLATSIDLMVMKLAESREKLSATAHRAGMAEVASEVLHNVGNAVNSAGCSAELLAQRLESSRLQGLEMAVALLSEQASNAAQFFQHDPRGPKLITYMESLTQTLRSEQRDQIDDLTRLRETIHHIRDVINTQQGNARAVNFRQKTDLNDLIDETIRINEQLLTESDVEVHISGPDLPFVNVNRSRLSQILVNLQKNAILAMQSVPGRQHRLGIHVDVIRETSLEISISDTGMGMTEEVRSRLFQQGFTTRSMGSGLGLHYCANVLREIGGEISAHSDGPGMGACFRIVIPQAVPTSASTQPINRSHPETDNHPILTEDRIPQESIR